jgi:hypothetical protein
MKTTNGYLEFDNPTPGANNLTLTVVERMDGGEIRQAICKVDSSSLQDFVGKLLMLRGIVEEVDEQRPAKTVKVEKIVDRIIEKLVEVPQIVQVDRVIEVPAVFPVDEIVTRIVDALKPSPEPPAEPIP